MLHLTPERKLEKIQSYLKLCTDCDNLLGGNEYQQLILQKGTSFFGRVPSDNYESVKNFCLNHRPKMKQCFYNSQMGTIAIEGARYFEGYVCEILPLHHAWLVMPDNKVVDVTLEAADRLNSSSERRNPYTVAYLGVEVPADSLEQYMRKYGSSEPFAQMYHLNSEKRFID